MVEIELSSLDVRYEGHRMKNRAGEARLLSSIAERGITESLEGVDEGERHVLLNGFKRWRCARRLGLNSAPYVSLGEETATGIVALLRASNDRALSLLEQAAFVDELKQLYGMNVGPIAEMLSRSKAWVSLRLGLLAEMPPAVRQKLFAGAFPVYAYMYSVRPFTGRCHSTQPASKRLFRQDIGLRCVWPQGHDTSYVPNIPPLTKHQNGHDTEVRAGILVEFPAQLAKRLQVLVADLIIVLDEFRARIRTAPDLLEFALQIRVQVDRLAVQLFERFVLVEARRDVICCFRVITHHEQQRLLPALLPLLTAFLPACIPKPQVTIVTVSGIVTGLFAQTLVALSDDQGLHDAAIHGLAQGRIADDVLEQLSPVVLRRCCKVELCYDFPAGARFDRRVQVCNRFVPSRIGVPHVVCFVVEHHNSVVTRDPITSFR